MDRKTEKMGMSEQTAAILEISEENKALRAEIEQLKAKCRTACVRDGDENMAFTEIPQDGYVLMVRKNGFTLPEFSPQIAARQAYNMVGINYEGARSEKPWYIYVDGDVELEGEKGYLIWMGQGGRQGDDVKIRVAVMPSRQVFLDDAGRWMRYGEFLLEGEKDGD